MRFLRTLMRIYSYFFHGLLTLFLLAVSGVALLSGTHNLKLDMLPWKGKNLTYSLLFSALFGLFSLILALKGTLRLAFFAWSVAVAVMVVKGFFLSPYFFSGATEFRNVIGLTVASLLAVIGAWFQLRRRRTS